MEIADFKDMTHWTHEFEGFLGGIERPSQITAMKFIEIWGGNFSDKATWIFRWDMNSDLRNKTWGYITLKYVGILDGIGYVTNNMGMA